MTVLEFLDATGASPFAAWFSGLDPTAAARVTTAINRLALGNVSNVKGVGAGVFEYRIDFGPGYRVYFGKDGDTIVILLGGGTKKRQDRDITAARQRWSDYKKRTAQEN
jgi:putative addiction module killer protein